MDFNRNKNNLKIKNPSGFRPRYFLSLQKGTSVLKDEVLNLFGAIKRAERFYEDLMHYGWKLACYVPRNYLEDAVSYYERHGKQVCVGHFAFDEMGDFLPNQKSVFIRPLK